MKQKQIIGILGGMGPQASVEFYRLVIDKAVREYGVKVGDEYPEFVIDSVPVPDCFVDTSKLEIATRMLEDRVRRLTVFGVVQIAMTCNTMHTVLPRLQSQTPVRIISIIEEVTYRVGIRSSYVLLLASPTTLRTGLYQESLKRNGIRYVQPDKEEYDVLDHIISGILAGEDRMMLQAQLHTLADRILSKYPGVDGIVLGCTELPLIFPKKFRVPVYSSLSILADSVLKRYYTKENI